MPEGAKPTKELLKYLPQLSLKERDRRWDGIRKKMLLANIDVFDPRWKPDVGCMFGDMMVVKKGGAQKMVNTPLELPQNG